MTQSIIKFDISEGQIKWMTFLCLVALFPAVYFLLFEIVKWPVLIVIMRVIPVIIDRGTFEWLFIFLLESLLWIGVFYLFSVLTARKLSELGRKWRFAFFTAIMLASLVLAMSPVFDFSRYNVASKESAFYLYFTDEKLF